MPREQTPDDKQATASRRNTALEAQVRIQYQEFTFQRRIRALIDTANDIIAEYAAEGYTLSLRQLYYQFVARDLIENSERSYKALGNTINNGRLAGLISWNAIEDRGRGIIPWLIEEDEASVLDDIENSYALDYWRRQDAYIEVWVEKDALTSVIERPCGEWRVPYMPCKGYLSASEAWRAGRRFKRMAQRGRNCVLIHLGDHDPSGIDMTRDNSHRLTMFAETYDVEVRRIALNMDQVQQYNPPPNPTKLTDTRAADYLAAYGETCWELDALEPRVIAKLIDDTIREYVDLNVWQSTQDAETEARETLSQLHDRYDDIKAFLMENPL